MYLIFLMSYHREQSGLLTDMVACYNYCSWGWH